VDSAESPERRRTRKRSEWDEEEAGDYAPQAKAKTAPESLLAKLGRLAGEATGTASKPWGRLMKDDDDE
jgi:hypothetical protein